MMFRWMGSRPTVSRIRHFLPDSLILRLQANSLTCRCRCFGQILWKVPLQARLSRDRKDSGPVRLSQPTHIGGAVLDGLMRVRDAVMRLRIICADHHVRLRHVIHEPVQGRPVGEGNHLVGNPVAVAALGTNNNCHVHRSAAPRFVALGTRPVPAHPTDIGSLSSTDPSSGPSPRWPMPRKCAGA